MLETLDKVAKAPIQTVWNLLIASTQGIVTTPDIIGKAAQAFISIITTALIAPAAAWFIAFKATEVTVSITSKAITVTARH